LKGELGRGRRNSGGRRKKLGDEWGGFIAQPVFPMFPICFRLCFLHKCLILNTVSYVSYNSSLKDIIYDIGGNGRRTRSRVGLVGKRRKHRKHRKHGNSYSVGQILLKRHRKQTENKL
jgi:hypothetical protein